MIGACAVSGFVGHPVLDEGSGPPTESVVGGACGRSGSYVQHRFSAQNVTFVSQHRSGEALLVMNEAVRTATPTRVDDQSGRLWDPATATPVLVIPVRLRATTCTSIDETLVVGLADGMIAIDINGA